MGFLTGLAVGLVAALGNVAEPLPPTLYVSPNGSDARDCRSPATACASFDRAYHAAAPGEVVEIAGGTYDHQHLSPDDTKVSDDDVVLQAAPGAKVIVGCPDDVTPGDGLWPHNCLATEGADHVTVKGVTTIMLPDIDGKAQQGGVSLDRGSADVTFDDVDAGHIFIASSDSTVRGGDYGPTVAAVSKIASTVGPDIAIDGARFHDHLRKGEQHAECISLDGARGVRIRNSRFDTCEVFSIFVTPEVGDHLNDVVIENNFFTNSGNIGMSAHLKIGSHGGDCTNFLIRNNTFVHDGVIAECGVGTGSGKGLGDNIRWIGNIFESFNGGTCALAPHVFDYNVIEAGKGCGPNDLVVGDVGFVNRAARNLHLRRDSPAIGRGSPIESPADDIDGEGRPFGPLPDAGADEYVPGPEVSIGDAPPVVEGGTAKFPVTLAAPAAAPVEVDWETRPSINATAPEDFVAASGTLVLAPGDTEGEISVQVNDDALDENDVEIFSVRLTEVRGGELDHATGVGAIIDDDLEPTVSVEDAQADEGQRVDFKVRLSQVADRDVRVRVSTSDGTAKAPADYAAAVLREVVIPAGQLEVVAGVLTPQDSVDEEDEQFTFAIVGGDTATGTIRDDDTAVPSIRGALAVEGGPLTFQLSLSATSSRDVRLRVATADGTAKAPDDYAAADAEVVIPAGATTAPFAVTTEEDELDEDDETFTASIAGGGGTATGTIVDDDSAPTVGVAAAEVDEGGELVFRLSLSAVAGRAVKVTASTLDGSAKSPADFVARSADVPIPAGSTSATFAVHTVEDGLDEDDETFTLSLSGGASATGTILDDDTATPSIAGASAEEGGELGFVVSLSGPSTRPVSVRLATSEGSAKAPADFAARDDVVVVPAGELSGVFAVQSAEDVLDEDDETFTVSVVGGGGLATGTILDDDERGNEPPQASIEGPATGFRGEAVPLTGTASDPDGTVDNREWDLDDDGEFDDGSGSAASPTFATLGAHEVRFRVTDQAGASTVATKTVTVENKLPVASIGGAGSTFRGQVVTLTATDSDGDGSVVERAWDVDGDGFDDGTEMSASASFGSLGEKTVRFRVTDSDGGEFVAAMTVTVLNRAPTAGISGAVGDALRGVAVALSGSAADPDGDGTIVAREWDTDDDGEFDDATGASASPVFTSLGTHEVRFRVTDDAGDSDVETATVTVVNLDPSASIGGAATAFRGEPVELTVAGSDADGSIVELSWDVDGDGFDDGTGASVTASFGSLGEKTVRLRVTDNDGGTVVATKTVTLQNKPPSASIDAPATPLRGVPVLISADDSDADGTIAAHAWELDGDDDFDDRTDRSISLTFDVLGTRTLKLRVTDDDGATSTVATATVRVVNQEPSASIDGPAEVLRGVPVTLTSSASDADGTIAATEWDVDGDGFDDGTTTSISATFGGALGDRMVRLRVTDDDGGTVVATKAVEVRNQDPLPSISGSAAALRSAAVTLTAGGSDPDGTIAEREWDVDGDGFDDGTGTSVSPTFDTLGPKIVRLRVTDEDGGTAVAEKTVDVSNHPPAAAISGADTAFRGAPVELSAAGSDPDGSIAERAWDVDGDGFDDGTGTSASASFGSLGEKTVRLRVVDNDGGEFVAGKTITVVNRAPSPAIGGSADGVVGGPVALTGTAGDPDGEGTIVARGWDLDDDGEFDDGTGPSASPTFATPGARTVRFRVTDDGQVTVIVTKTVTIVPAGSSGGGGVQPAPDTASPKIRLGAPSGQKIKKARNGVKITLTSDEPCRIEIAMKLGRKVARKLGLGNRTITVAKGTMTLWAGTSTATVQPTAQGQKALKRAKKLRKLVLDLTLIAIDAAGNAVTRNTELTLKR